jgi:hypothetical protein
VPPLAPPPFQAASGENENHGDGEESFAAAATADSTDAASTEAPADTPQGPVADAREDNDQGGDDGRASPAEAVAAAERAMDELAGQMDDRPPEQFAVGGIAVSIPRRALPPIPAVHERQRSARRSRRRGSSIDLDALAPLELPRLNTSPPRSRMRLSSPPRILSKSMSMNLGNLLALGRRLPPAPPTLRERPSSSSSAVKPVSGTWKTARSFFVLFILIINFIWGVSTALCVVFFFFFVRF